MQFEQQSDVQPGIGCLYSRSTPFGPLLDYAIAYVFIDSPFARRIQNALALLSHADTVGDRPVAISLYVSALEALLCSRHSGKTEQLKRRIPAVLQADQELAEDSFIAVKALYNVRSRCLHGEVTSYQSDLLRDVPAVRRLLAAVLRGALEWAAHNEAAPAHTDESEWTKELEATTRNSSQITHITGITKDLAEHLRVFTFVFGKDRIKVLLNEADDE